MSTNELNTLARDLKELRLMAEQLDADIEAVRELLPNEKLMGIALFRTGEFSYVKMSELGVEDLDQAIAKVRESMPEAGCVYIV